MPRNYKEAKYTSLVGQEGQRTYRNMGFKSFLARVDKFIQVPHGPVTSKTQLFLTKYRPSRWLGTKWVAMILTLYRFINESGARGISLRFGLLIQLISIRG